MFGIKPLGDRVVIKKAEAEEKTVGGLILTSAAKEMPHMAEVVAVGPGTKDEPMELKVGDKVIFLRKLERGGSEHSFGIHVAEIAGMPKSIVKRANVILKQLEADAANVGNATKANVQHLGDSREGMQLSFFQLDDPILSQIRDEILGLDINNLTPVEALNKLNEIKKILKGGN